MNCLRVALMRARCSMTLAAYTLARISPTCLDGSGLAVRTPTIAATAPSSRSPIPTTTVGCCRKSRSGFPGRGVMLDVVDLAQLLHETSEHHGSFETVAPAHDWWDCMRR